MEMTINSDDSPLASTLSWALRRMKEAGYPIKSNVTIVVDPGLRFMGYAEKHGDTHYIVVADWALDSEMLGGLVLHELAHIYYTEHDSPTHRSDITGEILQEAIERGGLTEKETSSLTDAFNHLQNILVDDVVFASMTAKEVKLAERFFSEWVSEHPTGDSVVDASLMARNAFAIASLKRRGLADGLEDMLAKNARFLSFFGEDARREFDEIEAFLEGATAGWSVDEFRKALSTYLGIILFQMKSQRGLRDLR